MSFKVANDSLRYMQYADSKNILIQHTFVNNGDDKPLPTCPIYTWFFLGFFFKVIRLAIKRKTPAASTCIHINTK